jgi:hypothetical protein
MEGWIKIHRRIMNWEWYHDSQTVHLFIHLMVRANHDTGSWQGNQVKRGQLITGRKQLSVETGISEKGIRTRIQRLKNSGEIEVKSASKFSVITICNYDEYQTGGIGDGPAKGQQRASKGPAKGQQRATNKNEKNEKNEKNISSVEKIKTIRPGWWTVEQWSELIAYRRSIKTASMTPRAFKLLITQFEIARNHGETAESILDDLNAYGWKGYHWEWVQNKRSGGSGVNGKRRPVESNEKYAEKDYQKDATKYENLPSFLQ